MLVDLVLTVCLIATGGDCHKEHMVIQGDGSLYGCMAESPVHIARWTSEHPTWRVKRWTCALPGTAGDEI